MKNIALYSHKKQSGISLFVVMVVILLAMLLSVWAARSSLFNELIVSNDADYQRAYEAAEALVQDAETDIRTNSADTCVRDSSAAATVCRPAPYQQFILETNELGLLLNDLTAVATTQCKDAICAKRVSYQDWWNNPTQLEAMQSIGARYGTYTGAIKGDKSNPLLNSTTSGEGGHYWIEILSYEEKGEGQAVIEGSTSNTLTVNAKPLVAYRITAVVKGLKAATRAVIQSTYVQNKTQE